jgi:hypothetical protein
VKPTRLTVERRFCGPPDHANGGYVGGLLFEMLDPPNQCAQVTLRRPLPVESEVEARPARRGGVDLVAGGEVLVEAEPANLSMEIHPPVPFADAGRAARDLPDGAAFQFRGCFVCGADRGPRDGLGIRPGPVPKRTTVAAPWIPDHGLTGPGDLVRQRYVWAALDCPGAYALHLNGAGDEPLVLGRMTAKVIHPLAAGERCVVTAWPIGADGRRLFAGTAIHNEQGWLVALTTQTWFPAAGRVPGA